MAHKEGLLVIISAPSGAGKTSICREIEKNFHQMVYSVSYTTRAARPGEINGHDYHFISQLKFNEMVKQDMFLEHAIVHGNSYGTGRDSTFSQLKKGLDIILDVDSQGGMQIKKKISLGVYIYLLPPSLHVLENRLRKRATDNETIIAKRLKKAKSEIKSYDKYDYLVVNDHFQTAVDEIRSILVAEKLKLNRINHNWIEKQFLNPDN